MSRLEPGSVVAGLRIERELGRGAFGVVYLAQDDLIGRPVALKVVHSAAARKQGQDRALREARAVGRLKSPHIVTLHRVHPLDDEGWLLEMEYIPGGSLTELLAQSECLPLDRAVAILRGVLIALRAAHEAGVVHGDVKPGNVLLERDGHVKLADFGLSWMMDDADLSVSADAGPVGTPAYMAPEVIMGEHGRKRSDLWSAGVVFYRMLTGELPFRTSSLHDLFFSVQNSAPQALPVTVPGPVRDLVLRLLAKTPEQRPASAAAVIEELDALAGAPAAAPAQVPAPLPILPPAPLLFGRDTEIDRLRDMLDELEQGRGKAILLSGEAGSGKTALVQTTVHMAQARGMWPVEATMTALQGALRPLLRAANRLLEQTGSALSDLSGSELSPQMVQDLLEGRVDENLRTRQQLAWALAQLFSNLSSRAPVVLVVENAHHADAEDHKLLRELARRLGRARVLFLVTYRTHDIEASVSDARSLAGLHDLASLDTMERIDLAPLTDELIFKLIEHRSQAVRIDPGVARRVIDLSQGNPLFALELMQHLQAQGAILMDGSSIRAAPAWGGPSLPARFHELVACRVAGLTEPERALLDAAAVDGREFDGEALQAVLGRPLLDVLRDLQRLFREHNLIEPHGEGYRFTSTLVQEVIHEETAPALRRVIHRNLAEHLETRRDGVDSARLGMHWERAGQPARAVPYLLRAAEGAAARQEHGRLVDLCERAGMDAGKVDGAAALNHLETLLSLAHAYRSLGQDERMERIYSDLLRAAEAAGDEQAACRVEVRRIWTRQETDAKDVELLHRAIDLLPLCSERGDAHYLLGVKAKYRGELAEAGQWLRAADEDYNALDLVGPHGTVTHQLGAIAWRAERLEEAEELFGRAARISHGVGKKINASASEVNQALVRFDRGQLDGLEEILERCARTLTLERSTMSPSASVILGQVRYAVGDMAGAVRALEKAREMVADTTHLPSQEMVLLEDGHLCAVRGQLEAARESLEQAAAIAARREHRMGQVGAACLQTQLLCFLGDPAGAAEAARRAVELARGAEEQATRDEPALWLAEATLYGLSRDCVPPTPDPFVAALRSLAEPAAEIVVPDALPGRRRATFEVIRDWLALESSRRRGGEGIEEIESALEQARALGHVWLEAALLRRLHSITADPAQRECYDGLVWRLADGLDRAQERQRLLDAWSSPRERPYS